MGLELNKKDRSSVKDVELFRVKDEVRVRSRPVTRIFPGGAKMGAAGEIFFLLKSHAWFVFMVMVFFITLSIYAIKTNLFNKCI